MSSGRYCVPTRFMRGCEHQLLMKPVDVEAIDYYKPPPGKKSHIHSLGIFLQILMDDFFPKTF